MGRYCEEFRCTPAQAIREIEHGPLQLALDIIELRAYERTKRAVEEVERAAISRAEKGQDMGGLDLPDTPMVRRVVETRRELEGLTRDSVDDEHNEASR